MTAQRDVFLTELRQLAENNPDIVLLSADMGAPALDEWREKLPQQFFATGISEQNTINVAAGLAASGKTPVVYFMASWVARCFEQIRYSCALQGLPVTILGNGVGFGYAPAGPAHEPTEDLAYMRSISGVEIWSPVTSDQVVALARLTMEMPALRYIRLERSLPSGWDATSSAAPLVAPDQHENIPPMRLLGERVSAPDVTLVASGYSLGRAQVLRESLIDDGVSVNVLDLTRVKPLDVEALRLSIQGSQALVTIEEHFLSGGLGAAIAEFVCDWRLSVPLLRIGVPDRYSFENGNREERLALNGMSHERIRDRVRHFLADLP